MCFQQGLKTNCDVFVALFNDGDGKVKLRLFYDEVGFTVVKNNLLSYLFPSMKLCNICKFMH